MKKLSVITTMLFVLSLTLKAQLSYGVKLGANLYTYTGGDIDGQNKKFKIGFGAGGFVNIPFHEVFSIQPELLFSQEGVLWKETDYKETENLNYINVPVLLQYRHQSGFFAETGPQIGFIISAKQKVDDAGEEEELDIKDDFKSTNFAWVLGVGYRMSNGLGFGVRYNLGLTSIVDYEDVDVKSTGFHAGVSYFIGRK